MKTLQLREAKSAFSSVVEAAERGEPTIVTKHGRAAAMIVPVEEGRKLFPDKSPSFADLLLAIPSAIPIERDESPMRNVDL
ncbi:MULTISPECIES: type II toxin-antitoxin system Phd/YefM family antitoxin [unclassified Aureimonas]|uniref:type II toxin-antitoxin system Phd/YefM family antitoxin n=1 Tax=unclassified Aureimonas TaxID=2615206 RepID=UPI0007022852|nr:MULTISPECIES: type II toxin-antitoxin system prevent-host-death family antitoxin [unclassified Aureimonas]KQT64133.1 prevent-host-death protein [Aureimonas sp. Leaf427]KQT81322.1 prevent-host-death protein [Aureimonas sp. Leaf460]